MNQQTDIVDAVVQHRSAEELVGEIVALKDKIKSGSDQFDTWAKPFKEKIAANENAIMALLNEQRIESVRTDAGTAYLSTITSFKVINREAVLKVILDNWESFGSEALLLNVQKDAVKRYMDEHEGALPDGLTSDSFRRLNIRRA